MFYIEHEGKIVLFDEDKQKLQNTLAFMPQFADKEILETERPIVDFQFADTEEYAAEQETKAKADRVSALKTLLSDTDYIAAKIAEGSATREEYADIISQRQAWRKEINNLEGKEDDRNS